MTKENLLLLGATGFIGSYITTAILARKESFGRIVVFTSPSTASSKKDKIDELKAQGVEVIVGDVADEEVLGRAFEGITTILSFVGRAAIASQIAWISLAQKVESVKRFFPSEYGTDIEYDESSKTEIPHQAKLKVRAALRAQDRLEYTFVVTGPYVEGFIGTTPAAPEAGSFDVKNKKAYIVGDGTEKVSVISMPDVGTLTTHTLLLPPQKVRNRAIIINSFTTTPLAILAEYERQTGGQKWDVVFTPIEKVKELEREAHAAGKGNATIYTLRRIWAEGRTVYDVVDNGLVLGEGEGVEERVKLEGLEGAVRRAVEVQVGK